MNRMNWCVALVDSEGLFVISKCGIPHKDTRWCFYILLKTRTYMNVVEPESCVGCEKCFDILGVDTVRGRHERNTYVDHVLTAARHPRRASCGAERVILAARELRGSFC